MKVKELAKELNEQIKNVDFSPIHNHTDFHKKIEQTITQLPKGLTLHIWEIRNHSNYEDQVITYTRDFEKYKNSKYSDKGKFSNIKFIAEPLVANLKIEELNGFFEEKHKQEEIINLQKDIKTYKETIKVAEKRLKELQ